jgi:DNA (cytosine-5)-methyltransferase 1
LTLPRFAGAGATAQFTAGQVPRLAHEPAHTITGKSTAVWLDAEPPAWPHERPSPTIVGTRRSDIGGLVGRQLDDDTRRDNGGHVGGVGLRDSQLPGIRVTVAEAALLQSYPTHIEQGAPMSIVALDLFAGHGWGVACQWLGIEEHGVEIMKGAQATRAANGMSTVYSDVWDGLEANRLLTPAEAAERVRVLGKLERGEALTGYDLLIASPPCQTFSMAGGGAGRRALDEVVGLVDSGAYRDVAKLREFGETHDPRTALVLTPLAHVYRDLPRYVVLEQVPPVLPVWKRMATELEEWGYSTWTGVLNAEQYGVPQTRKRAILIAIRDPEDGIAAPPTPTHSRYHPTDKTRLDDGVLPWVSMAEALGWTEGESVRSNYGTGGNPANRGERLGDEPSSTVTSKTDRNVVFVSNDKRANSARRGLEEPAPTTTAGHDSGNRVWQHEDGRDIRLDPALPATTVAADPRLSSREHHNHGEQNSTSTKVTQAEAAALQSYPRGFVWPGTKTQSMLEIGNAVPPLLARAVLEAVLGL